MGGDLACAVSGAMTSASSAKGGDGTQEEAGVRRGSETCRGPPVFPTLEIPLTAVGLGPEESPRHLSKASVQASEVAQQVETHCQAW